MQGRRGEYNVFDFISSAIAFRRAIYLAFQAGRKFNFIGVATASNSSMSSSSLTRDNRIELEFVHFIHNFL